MCTCYVDIYKHAIIRKRTTIRTNYTYLLIYHVHQDYGAFWCTSTYSYIQKCKGTFHVCIRKKIGIFTKKCTQTLYFVHLKLMFWANFHHSFEFLVLFFWFFSIDDTWEGQRQKGQIERSLGILRFCWEMRKGSSILNLSKKIDFENYVKSTRRGSISGNRLL